MSSEKQRNGKTAQVKQHGDPQGPSKTSLDDGGEGGDGNVQTGRKEGGNEKDDGNDIKPDLMNRSYNMVALLRMLEIYLHTYVGKRHSVG